VFVKGLCTNVTDQQFLPSDLAVKSVFISGANEDCSSSMEGDGKISASVGGARTYNTKGLKKRKHRLSRNQDRRPGADMKRTSFNHSDYRSAQGAILSSNQNSVTPPVASSLPNQGHSPTKAEVKRINQCLLDENLCLKKDFHKAKHCLKTLLADKKDLQRRLWLESKTSNNLIESIQAEANDMMKRARDIFSYANRSKNETELLKDEIDKSRKELLGVRMDLRKQSARLKKQAARMTETHNRRKRALAEQRKEIVNDVITEKKQWNVTVRFAEKKMRYSLKQLQKERMMWQVLSQEAAMILSWLSISRSQTAGHWFRCS